MKIALAGLSLLLAFASMPALADEPYCREYTKRVIIGSKVERGYGTACLQPDGDWEIVSQDRVLPSPTYRGREEYVIENRRVTVRPGTSTVIVRPGYTVGSAYYYSPQSRNYRHHRDFYDRRSGRNDFRNGTIRRDNWRDNSWRDSGRSYSRHDHR